MTTVTHTMQRLKLLLRKHRLSLPNNWMPTLWKILNATVAWPKPIRRPRNALMQASRLMPAKSNCKPAAKVWHWAKTAACATATKARLLKV